MSQLQTFQDIKLEILTKAGEVTNGNSPYESVAIAYATRAHAEIIGGANIFNLQVAEPWVWARARTPIILELQPSISGTATFTYGSPTISFGAVQTTALEGWHIQANGKPTVYKITNHSAGSTEAQVDSSFVDSSGSTYGFRAFKLDYEVVPKYVYIGDYNDQINFHDGLATVSTVIPHGTFTPAQLISQVAGAMQSAGVTAAGTSFVGNYDPILRQFSIQANAVFTLLGASGAGARRSVLQTLGYDFLDTTSSSVVTAHINRATYPLGGISRLIEPFRIFTGGTQQPFIYSTDPIRMQQDYPLHLIRERVPDRFVRLTEDKDGAVWVRFNGFPKDLTKVQIDWIPRPIDLQDNTASVVLLPYTDVNTLIHLAAAYILLDKEDDKFPQVAGFAKDGLNAMMANNRLALQRTGEHFGQIVPRADLSNRIMNRLNYGYTSGNN